MIINLDTGTHIDSPWHFLEKGKKLEGLLVNQFVGEGLIIDLSDKYSPSRGIDQIISREDLTAAVERTKQEIKPGDMVIIYTGWNKIYESDPEKYYNHCASISSDSGTWLAKQKIKLVGIDTCTVDPPSCFTKVPFNHAPNHINFLSKGILVCESIGGEIDKILNKRLLIVALPLNIKGKHGAVSPARVIAIE
jgi:kynurenine formamidase